MIGTGAASKIGATVGGSHEGVLGVEKMRKTALGDIIFYLFPEIPNGVRVMG